MTRIRDWKGKRDMSARPLEERTGEDVDVWNRRVRKESFNDEKASAALQDSRRHTTPDQLHDTR
jgi:hypothetical protein